jgi:exonuclease III
MKALLFAGLVGLVVVSVLAACAGTVPTDGQDGGGDHGSFPSDCGAWGDGTSDDVLDDGAPYAADHGGGPDLTQPAASEELRIVSWNVWHGNSKANFVDALAEFEKEGIDIVGFQELSDNGKPEALVEKTGCAACYYQAWKPGKPGQGGNVSIIWKKSRFSVAVDAQGAKMQYAVKVHDSQPVEEGAGGSTAGTKYIVYVLLQDKLTNRSLWAMNAHALPSVEGQCGHPNDNILRLTLYKQMMDTFKAKITNKTKPVFVTGDYNVNYRCDKNVQHHRFPWKSFNSLSPKVKSNWEWHEKAGLALPAVGTHKPHLGGKRLIDYVFARSDPAVSYKGTAIWQHRRFGSDHAPVRATYQIKVETD